MKKASELKEGESLTYRLAHTDAMRLMFICEYSRIEGGVFYTPDPTIGYSICLDPATLDRIQEEAVRNGATLIEE